jgi:hypothetical protein
VASRLTGLTFAGLVIAAVCAAPAQQLQRLHVRSFTLTTDTQHPQPDVPFNVTVSIHVKENVQIQNVYLPAFFGPEELGDVRTQSRGRTGTLYRETLTLVAHSPGHLTIGSAYLDAIDARDGKPVRFRSNNLDLVVQGGAALPRRGTAWALVLTALALLTVVAVFALKRPRRTRAVVVEEPPPPLAPVIPIDPNPFQTALAELRVRRDRAAVMRVRSTLWHIAGASDGETLHAVLRRPEAIDLDLRRMLVAVERAAFVDDQQLSRAIDDVLQLRQMSTA